MGYDAQFVVLIDGPVEDVSAYQSIYNPCGYTKLLNGVWARDYAEGASCGKSLLGLTLDYIVKHLSNCNSEKLSKLPDDLLDEIFARLTQREAECLVHAVDAFSDHPRKSELLALSKQKTRRRVRIVGTSIRAHVAYCDDFEILATLFPRVTVVVKVDASIWSFAEHEAHLYNVPGHGTHDTIKLGERFARFDPDFGTDFDPDIDSHVCDATDCDCEYGAACDHLQYYGFPRPLQHVLCAGTGPWQLVAPETQLEGGCFHCLPRRECVCGHDPRRWLDADAVSDDVQTEL